METETRTATEDHGSLRTPSYIVGIGASAGGLEAIERFFDNVPQDTGMAFVIVQHLSPDFKSCSLVTPNFRFTSSRTECRSKPITSISIRRKTR